MVVELWLTFFTPRPTSDDMRGPYKGVAKKQDHNPTAFRTQ
jgi:hypothetical protein